MSPFCPSRREYLILSFQSNICTDLPVFQTRISIFLLGCTIPNVQRSNSMIGAHLALNCFRYSVMNKFKVDYQAREHVTQLVFTSMVVIRLKSWTGFTILDLTKFDYFLSTFIYRHYFRTLFLTRCQHHYRRTIPIYGVLKSTTECSFSFLTLDYQC